MSNLWLNIRFGVWHLQCEYGKLLPRFKKNDYHIGKPFRIEVFDFRFPFK